MKALTEWTVGTIITIGLCCVLIAAFWVGQELQQARLHQVPHCYEDEVVVGVGNFSAQPDSPGVWTSYVCRNREEVN